MNSRQQGSTGVAAAIKHFTDNKISVFVPLFENQKCDLVVLLGGGAKRIECKTTRTKAKSGNYTVELRTKGGNQSWGGTVSKVSDSDVDYLFVHTGSQDWLIPAHVVSGKSTVTLYGKYDEYKL